MALLDFISDPINKAGAQAAQGSLQQQRFLEEQWRQQLGMQQPFVQQGQQAFGLYGQYAGLQGPEAQQQLLRNYQMTPQAQFGLQQNLAGLNQGAAAQGGLFGGNRMRDEAAMKTQGYQTDLANYLERLRAQAGLGQQAAGSLGQIGGQFTRGITGAMLGQGSAIGNAALAGAQAQQQLISSGIGVVGQGIGAMSGGAA